MRDDSSSANLPDDAGPDFHNIEARTRGYDLGDYELPKADYNSANDTWSVSYAPRGADTKALNVTIQDKNGKAEIKK